MLIGFWMCKLSLYKSRRQGSHQCQMYHAHELLKWLMIAEGKLICGSSLLIDYRRCGMCWVIFTSYRAEILFLSFFPSLPVKSCLFLSQSIIAKMSCSCLEVFICQYMFIVEFLFHSWNLILLFLSVGIRMKLAFIVLTLFCFENYTYLGCFIICNGTSFPWSLKNVNLVKFKVT